MTDAASVLAQFAIDEAGLVRACRAMLHRKRSVRLVYMFLAVVFVIGVAHLVLFRDSGKAFPPVLYAAILGGSVAGALATWLTPKTSVSALTKGSRNPFGVHEFRLGAPGIHIKAEFATVEFEWEAVREVWEDSEFLYFYLNDNYAQLLPKKALPDGGLSIIHGALDSWLGAGADSKNHTRKA